MDFPLACLLLVWVPCANSGSRLWGLVVRRSSPLGRAIHALSGHTTASRGQRVIRQAVRPSFSEAEQIEPHRSILWRRTFSRDLVDIPGPRPRRPRDHRLRAQGPLDFRVVARSDGPRQTLCCRLTRPSLARGMRSQSTKYRPCLGCCPNRSGHALGGRPVRPRVNLCPTRSLDSL
jgi:hypothetical protein